MPDVTLTHEEYQALLEKATAPPSAAMTFEQFMAGIERLREPDDETKEKKAKERARREQAALESVMIAAEAEEQKKATIAACARTGHVKENGRTAIQGQVHSDGKFHGICFHCGWAAPPVAIAADSMAGGVEQGGASSFSFGVAPSSVGV